MQNKKIFVKSVALVSFVVLVFAITFSVSACQLFKNDNNKKEISFDNIIFMDDEVVLTPDGHPNPDDFVPEKVGHVFRYWVFKKNNVSTVFKSADYNGEPLTLYAVWQANEYTVRFVDSDGNPLQVAGKDEQKVKYGSAAIEPEEPQKYGYKFIGWDKSFENVTEDLTITAMFERIEFTVEFFFGEDSLVRKSVFLGEKITNLEKEAVKALSSFTSNGLTLEGWYQESTFENKINVSTVEVSESLKLYAKLTPSKIQNLKLSTNGENNSFVYQENLEIVVTSSYTVHKLLTYKTVWHLDGELLSGENKNQLRLTNLTLGSHALEVEITASFGVFSQTETKSIEINVTKKSLKVKANDVTIVYGDELPKFSYVVNSNDNLDLGVATYACSYKVGDPIGEYAITLSGLSSENYDLTFVKGTLTVVPKNITVQVENLVATYGDEVPEFKFTASGLLSGDFLVGGEYSSDYQKGSPVGKYEVSLSGLENSNYVITEYKNGILTVEKMVLQLKIESKSMVFYGDPKPEFEYKILRGELLAGDSLGTPNFKCDYSEGKDARRYTVTLDGLSNPNYEIQVNTGWLTVYPKEVDVVWTKESEYVYSGVDQSETIEAVFVDIKGETRELTPKFEFKGNEVLFLNAGVYSVSVSLADSNYKLLNNVKSIEIKKRPITIDVHNVTITYGDDVPEYTYTALGVVGDDNLGKVEFDCAYEKGSKIGVYHLKAVGLENPNYEVSYNNALLTVEKRPVTVEWSTGSVYVYNGKIQSDTIHALFRKYDGKNTVMTLTYYLSDRVSGFKNAGVYRVVASTEDENYELIDAEIMITIAPKPLILTIDDKTITYGDDSPIFTFHTEGLASGEGDSVLGKAQYVCDYVRGADAGRFEISCKPLTNPNYSITYVNATLTVNKMAVEAIWTFHDSYVYNGKSQSDTISVKIRGYAGNYLPLNVSFASGENKDFCHAGVYTVTAYGEVEKNYIINHNERTFEILPKKARLSALSKTVTYGDPIPTFSYEAYGLEEGDDLGEMSYECVYQVGSPSSNYVIAILPVFPNDYDLSYDDAILHVVNRIVNVEWESLERYVYNKTNQGESVSAKFLGYSGEYEIAELTFELKGKVCGFLASGEYLVTATHFDKNYTLENNTNTYVIERKAITVSANPLTITYGDNIPIFSYTAIGLEKDDFLIDESYFCVYERGSNVGSYTLFVDFAEQENYVITTVSALVTVNPMTVSVKWSYQDITYNGLTQNDAVQAEFLTYDNKVQKLNLTFSQNGEKVSFKNAGAYLASVDYENKNYVLTNVELETSIAPKELIVSVQNKNTFFGNSIEFSHAVSGLQNNESESVLGVINYLCDYEVGFDVGTYSINANGLFNPNYSIHYESAVLTISPRPVVAEWVFKTNYVYTGEEQIDSVGASYQAYTGESVQMEISISMGNSIFKNAGDYVFVAKNDDKNYEVSSLVTKITINKANYQNVVHSDLFGTYDPDFTLANYPLNDGFRWADDSILPIVKRTEYKAWYNVDSENYNDFELFICLTLAKADYRDITHKALSGVYNEKKTLASYALTTGFVWVDKTILPTVDKTRYQATYNLDEDNYNDYLLEIELKLAKANYVGITHKTLYGQYSPTQTLSDFALDSYFTWVDENITPTVGKTKYQAVYNRDKVNYNDYTLSVSVILKKAVYNQNEVPEHPALSGTYNPNGKLSDFELNDGFRWKNPNMKPTVPVREYEALFNLDEENYEDYTVLITLVLSKADYENISHAPLFIDYDEEKTLNDYSLGKYFRWALGDIVPTSETTKYLAFYNADPDNYNDKEVWITVVVLKDSQNEK